jgi:hypothetical protein
MNLPKTQPTKTKVSKMFGFLLAEESLDGEEEVEEKTEGDC